MNRNRLAVSALALVLLSLTLPANAASIQSPAGEGSLAPGLVTLESGEVVLSWLEPDAGGHALKFAVIGEAGFGAVRTIARGKGWFANWADTPAVFVLPGGDWLAHWLKKSGSSTYAYDVVIARSGDRGRSWSDPFVPHGDGTPTEHGFVSYFADGDDRAGLVWLDGRETTTPEGAMTLRTRSFGPGGAGPVSLLLDERVCDCCQTASAMTADGPVVIYRDRSPEEIRDHFVVRRVNGAWTEPRRLHEDGWRIGGCPVNGPAMIARGREVVTAWFTMPDATPRVRLARSTDAGARFALIDTLGEGTALGRVDLVAYGEGFVLSWIDETVDGGALRLTGYNAEGARLWQHTIEGIDAGRASGFPKLGVRQGCELIVAWTGKDDSGAQRVRLRGVDPADRCSAGA